MDDHQKISLTETAKKLHNLITELSESFPRSTGWRSVDAEILYAFKLWQEVVRIIANQLAVMIENIPTTSIDYQTCCGRLDVLYRRIDICKRMYGRFFADIDYELLLQYLFMQKLVETFQGTKIDGIHVVLSKEGLFSHSEISRVLAKPCLWFDETNQAQLSRLSLSNRVHWMTTSFDRLLNRQIVLAHEIFHSHVNKSTTTQEWLKNALKTQTEFSYDQLIELFCDYASAWHFGPCFAQAFVEEMRFVSSGSRFDGDASIAGISRIVRAKMVAAAFDSTYRHPHLDSLNQFIPQYQHENALEYQTIQDLGKYFGDYLIHDLNLDRCEPEDKSLIMLKYLQNRLPYCFSDIRTFLNNLPLVDNLADQNDRLHFPVFLNESLRISCMLNDFFLAANRLGRRLGIEPAFTTKDAAIYDLPQYKDMVKDRVINISRKYIPSLFGGGKKRGTELAAAVAAEVSDELLNEAAKCQCITDEYIRERLAVKLHDLVQEEFPFSDSSDSE